MAHWTFLSNHGVALVCVARDPGLTLREIGDRVGVTERTAHGIVSDLVEGGYLKRYHEGNRNRYEVQPDMPMRHPLMRDHMVGEVINVLGDAPQEEAPAGEGSASGGIKIGKR